MGYVIAVLVAIAAVLAGLWRREVSKRKAAEVIAKNERARAEASQAALDAYREAEKEAEKEHDRIDEERDRDKRELDDLEDKLRDSDRGTPGEPDERSDEFDRLFP